MLTTLLPSVLARLMVFDRHHGVHFRDEGWRLSREGKGVWSLDRFPEQ